MLVSIWGLSACTQSDTESHIRAQAIDVRVEEAVNYMYQEYPSARSLATKASGILVMPLISEAGLGIGGAFGRGALLVDGETVDYYALSRASVGFQLGAQQYSHALFFLTQEALDDFRAADGWALGGDLEYTIIDEAGVLAAETTTSLSSVVALVFAQAGLRFGASIEGAKYTRIMP